LPRPWNVSTDPFAAREAIPSIQTSALTARPVEKPATSPPADPGGDQPPAVRRLRHRTIRQRTLVRALGKWGFFRVRSKGRNLIFKHPSHEDHVAVPRHARDLANGTLENILRGVERILGRPVLIGD
jgi:predicted RNA binding protein YcfA (HicA-like mRNA interferase family)